MRRPCYRSLVKLKARPGFEQEGEELQPEVVPGLEPDASPASS